MTTPPRRTVFSQSRATEYLRLDTLRTMTGRGAHDFHRVVAKELIDNAFDAAESESRRPAVALQFSSQGPYIIITVLDNGNGIPALVVKRTLDFNTLTSDKALYCTPTRGQQGNALKTIFGMPFALGDGRPRVEIGTGAENHVIGVRIGSGDVVEVRHEVEAREDDHDGGRVSVWLPWYGLRDHLRTDPIKDLRNLVRGYHLFNPHADVSFFELTDVIEHDESEDHSDDKTSESHGASKTGYKKFMPRDPLVAHWFDQASFARLVRSYVSHDEDMPVGQFIRKFRGFSSNPKVSAARNSIPGVGTLSELTDANLGDLLVGMRDVAKEPSHGTLGDPVGEDHLVGGLRKLYGNGRSWYKMIRTTLNGAPAIVEAAVVDALGKTHIGLNHALTYQDLLSHELLLHTSGNDEVAGDGIHGFLRDLRLSTYQKNHAVAVHVMAATPTATDKGKTTLSVGDPEFTEAVARALWAVGKDLYKEARKRDRDAAAAERDAKRREAQRTTKRITKREACFEVMVEAYNYSTGDRALPTTARDLYYAVRNRIDRFGYDADELDYSYFSQTLLPEYQRDVGELPLVEYEPRGILYEPHDKREVRLGTRSVADYEFPDYLYNKILYIEKNGRVGILKAAGIDSRYDMAFIGGQGYASEAIRTLLENAEEGEYQLFVLHDADPHGYGIARTLREATERMPGYSVDVIDIGLKLEDALEMGKRPEMFTRRSRIDEKVEATLTAIEREHFVGEEIREGKGKPYWISQRVELNDLSSPQLVEYVEGKLADHDALPKVIPPESDLKERREEMYKNKVGEWVDAIVRDMLKTDELKQRIAADFEEHFKLSDARDWIEAGFAEDESQSWRDAVKSALEKRYGEHKGGLEGTVKDHVEGTVESTGES